MVYHNDGEVVVQVFLGGGALEEGGRERKTIEKMG